jgi:hypothetical protein
MKTAMQELIEYYNRAIFIEESPMLNLQLRKYRMKAQLLLEKEKEQIKDAWDAGMSEGIGTTMADLDWDGEFINYYNETYNQNK